jgi:hypothetical protein
MADTNMERTVGPWLTSGIPDGAFEVRIGSSLRQETRAGSSSGPTWSYRLACGLVGTEREKIISASEAEKL